VHHLLASTSEAPASRCRGKQVPVCAPRVIWCLCRRARSTNAVYLLAREPGEREVADPAGSGPGLLPFAQCISMSSPISPPAMTDPGQALIRWAERNGVFPGNEMESFCTFVASVAPICHQPDCLQDGIKIDEGAFGSIVRATFVAPGGQVLSDRVQRFRGLRFPHHLLMHSFCTPAGENAGCGQIREACAAAEHHLDGTQARACHLQGGQSGSGSPEPSPIAPPQCCRARSRRCRIPGRDRSKPGGKSRFSAHFSVIASAAR
jgi:hypothetical protein